MWKLKTAEGVDGPYLYSTNNYVGRQTWEFDPDAGTPEERAEVEEARQNFYKNRFQVKPSGDLLWRMQVSCVSFLTRIFMPKPILFGFCTQPNPTQPF